MKKNILYVGKSDKNMNWAKILFHDIAELTEINSDIKGYNAKQKLDQKNYDLVMIDHFLDFSGDSEIGEFPICQDLAKCIKDKNPSTHIMIYGSMGRNNALDTLRDDKNIDSLVHDSLEPAELYNFVSNILK